MNLFLFILMGVVCATVMLLVRKGEYSNGGSRLGWWLGATLAVASYPMLPESAQAIYTLSGIVVFGFAIFRRPWQKSARE